jgi:hypothetical protein
MMEAIRTSETSVNIYLTTWQYIPEDSKLHTRRRQNLKSHGLNISLKGQDKNFIIAGDKELMLPLKIIHLGNTS